MCVSLWRVIALSCAVLYAAPVFAGTDEDLKEVKEELTRLQAELVKTAQGIRGMEAELSAAENKIATLEKQEAEKTADYKQRERELAASLSGMIRLSRMPKETVIAMPGDYASMLRTAKVLGIASDALEQEAQALAHELEEINELKEKIKARRTILLKDKQKLESVQEAQQKRLGERKDMQSRLYKEQQRESAARAAAARKAASVKELVGDLAKGRTAPKDEPMRLRAFGGRKLRLPSEGRITSRFGGEEKGIHLLTRDSAQVVAPADGEVLFTGPFLDYGRMLILRHKGGFYCLLAGLTRIDAVPGQYVMEGEPLGAMGKKSAGTNLYLELRKEGKPVDPADYFTL